jgi:PKD repeat protein
MRKSLLLISLSLLFQLVHAQNPLVKQWDYRYGGTMHDQLHVIRQTSDGGFLMGGYSASNTSGNKTQNNRDTTLSSSDFWIVKTDGSGNMQWDKRFGGDMMDKMYTFVQTSDGGYLLGGISNSGISGDKSQGNWSATITYDYWIIKTDASGNKQWDKRYGGTNDDQLRSILPTSDGGYLLGGYSNSGASGNRTQNSQGGLDFWIVKIDASGNQLWDKSYGGAYDDYLYTVKQANNGGFMLGGSSWSYTGGDKTQPCIGLSDYWLIKTDSLGNKLWDKVYGGTESDDCYSMDQGSGGGFILGGLSASNISGTKTQASKGYADYWVVRVDDNGNQVWDRDYGGTLAEDEFSSVSSLMDGGYLISGTSYSDTGGDKTEDNMGPEQAWTVKTDSSGNVVWDKTLFLADHNESAFAIQTTDGCYAFANYTLSTPVGYKTQPSWASVDYWMVKFCDTTSVLISAPAAFLGVNDTAVCSGSCVNFNDLSVNNPTSWQWFFPGSSVPVSSLKNPSGICYNSSGTYDVTLIACNGAGCDTFRVYDYIHVDAVPSVNLGADTLMCIGDVLQLNAGNSFSSYLWSDGTSSSTLSVTAAGSYAVQIFSGSCAATDTIAVYYHSCGMGVNANFFSTDTSFCEKNCVDFYDLSLNNPTSWQWFFPGSDSITSNMQNPKGICYKSYGAFDITLIACNAGGCDTLHIPAFIREFEAPAPPVITVSNDTLYSTHAASYQWYFNSAAIAGATGSSYVYQQQGNYFVVITDSNGCGSSSDFIATGIESHSGWNGQISVIPNPASDMIYCIFKAPTWKSSRLSVMNALGQIIFYKEIPAGQQSSDGRYSISVSDFADGVYLVRIDTPEKSGIQKFVVRH